MTKPPFIGIQGVWLLGGLLLSGLLLGGLLAAGPAHAQAPPADAGPACDDALLDAADRYYDLGRFDEAIAALTPCLPGRPRSGEPHFRTRSRATSALRLVALSHLARREPETAKRWVEQLMKLDRRYSYDEAEDPLYFQVLVEELRPPIWYQKRWVQAGGALVVGAAIGYFAFRPEPQALPHPGDVFGPPDN